MRACPMVMAMTAMTRAAEVYSILSIVACASGDEPADSGQFDRPLNEPDEIAVIEQQVGDASLDSSLEQDSILVRVEALDKGLEGEMIGSFSATMDGNIFSATGDGLLRFEQLGDKDFLIDASASGWRDQNDDYHGDVILLGDELGALVFSWSGISDGESVLGEFEHTVDGKNITFSGEFLVRIPGAEQ